MTSFSSLLSAKAFGPHLLEKTILKNLLPCFISIQSLPHVMPFLAPPVNILKDDTSGKKKAGAQHNRQSDPWLAGT